MMDKVMGTLEALGKYPAWVLSVVAVLIVAVIFLLIIFSPSRSTETLLRSASVPLAWQPFIEGPCTIVVGTYYDKSIRLFEASALIGTGDALALGRLLATLSRVRRPPCEVLPSAGFPGDRLQSNLILIGGPDANEVSRKVLERLRLRIRFGDPDRHVVALQDATTGTQYVPARNADGSLSLDYGIAVRTRNPFNPSRSLILVAGSFGHGSHAAAQLLESDELLAQIEAARKGQDFEALLQTEVVNGWPQTPKLLQAYPL